MSDLSQIDSKGRINIPVKYRKLINIKTGDKLKILVQGNKIILEKIDNPFKKLEQLLKNISFDPEKRLEYEKLLLKDIAKNDN